MAANRAPRQRARVDLDGVTDADAERAGYPSCDALVDDLRRLDARAAEGARTARTLAVLRAQPAVRAGDLCHLVEQEKEPFKRNVRKLKDLGLTESLGTGYRLSPRGGGAARGAVEGTGPRNDLTCRRS